jgi:hypothetical protein
VEIEEEADALAVVVAEAGEKTGIEKGQTNNSYTLQAD